MTVQWLTPELIQVFFVCFSLTLLSLGMVVLYYDTRTLRDWKRRIQNTSRSSLVNPYAEQQQPARHWWQPFLERLGRAVKPSQEKELSRTSLRLLQAGYRHPHTINVYYGIKFGLMLFLPLTAFLLLFEALQHTSSLSASLPLYIYIVVMALVGTFSPDIWLNIKIKRRKERIGKGFPDALDLLVLCIESGLGIDAAMYRVAADIRLTHPFLSQELSLVTESIRAGQSRHAALTDLNRRVDLDDVHSFTNLIFQTEKLGVSITQSMKKIAEAMRVKRRIEAEELAAKLPVKLLFPVTVLIFPSILVVILMPAVIKLLAALSDVAK